MTDLEFWCFACITFTFGSLISYVVILFTLGCPVTRARVTVSGDQGQGQGKKKTSEAETDRNNVLELILFTITAGAFAMFNIIYWFGGI